MIYSSTKALGLEQAGSQDWGAIARVNKEMILVNGKQIMIHFIYFKKNDSFYHLFSLLKMLKELSTVYIVSLTLPYKCKHSNKQYM